MGEISRCKMPGCNNNKIHFYSVQWTNFAWRNPLACALCVIGLAILSSVPSSASDVNFGVVLNEDDRCTIRVDRSGKLGVNTDARQLSSMIGDGQSAEVFVKFGGRKAISVYAMPFFNQSPGGASEEAAFKSYFSGIAKSRKSFSQRSGDDPFVGGRGWRVLYLTIDLDVTRAQPFPAGDYSATTVVRCEPT